MKAVATILRGNVISPIKNIPAREGGDVKEQMQGMY